MVIGHTKLKTIKEQGAVEEQEFQVLDSNLNADYANIVAHKADVIATINVEREINESKRVTDTKRYIYFRGNGFVNAGTRFSNIVEKVELSAANFIKAIEDAIRNSMTTPIGDAEFQQMKAAEKIENKKKADEFIKAHKEDDVNSKLEKLDHIKANMAKISLDELMPIMTKHGVKDFNDAAAVPMQCLVEICELIA